MRTREHFVRSAPVSLVEMGNGDLMIDRFQFDIESGRMIDRRTYLRDGRQSAATNAGAGRQAAVRVS